MTANDVDELDSSMPLPSGDLTLKIIATTKDANACGDIYGGWLVAQMDNAGAVLAAQLAKGRVATVSIDSMVFLAPVNIGASISFYAKLIKLGRSSMRICVEAWATDHASSDPIKVTEANFTFVSIDDNRRTRQVGV